MNFLKVLTLSLLLTGCVTTQYEGLHPIITKNAIIYQESDNIEFLNIAAIFKEYTYITKSVKYQNIKELKKTTNNFLHEIRVGNISSNYPVKASSSEVAIVKSILIDTVSFIKKRDISANNFQSYMNKSIRIYVEEIVRYEN